MSNIKIDELFGEPPPGESLSYYVSPDALREVLRKSTGYNAKKNGSVYKPMGAKRIAKKLALPGPSAKNEYAWERAIIKAVRAAAKDQPNISPYYGRPGERRVSPGAHLWIYVPDHAIAKRAAENAKREAEKVRMDVIETKLIEAGAAYERNWDSFTLDINALENLLGVTP